jgi:hypothetical protein
MGNLKDILCKQIDLFFDALASSIKKLFEPYKKSLLFHKHIEERKIKLKNI